jgi:phosphopantothenoylcysteine decarboxylase/phosphopantothenate--cysteine ligase
VPNVLTGKRILLVVTGGIAAYKAAELVRVLQRHNATVRVALTAAATRFVTPLTFEALSGQPVATELFAPGEESRINHIQLAREADCLVVAPATANFLAKLSWGLADDLPSTVALACRAPLVLAPAMNVAMLEHPATQDNLRRLAARPGVVLVSPAAGELACGETGAGRLAPLEEIAEAVLVATSPKDLDGLRLLVTAGPTEEPVDAVRYLSNRSSGRMGYALARVAHRRGAQVVLVSGPVLLPRPPGVTVVDVRTARELQAALDQHAPAADALIMAAAVADLRPATTAPGKLRKAALGDSLPLAPNPDLLAELGERGVPPLRIGFAAETEPGLEAGLAKLAAKGCQLLALNRVDLPDRGFGVDDNEVILLDRQGVVARLPLASKERIAAGILDQLARRWRELPAAPAGADHE